MDRLLNEINEYTEKINLNPTNKQLYLDRAVLYNKVDKFELAMNDYDEIIKIDSKDDYAYYERACEWYNWKIYYLDEVPNAKEIKKNAIEYLRRALSIKENPQYYYRIAEIEFNLLNEEEKALEMCKKAIILKGKTLEFCRLLGEIHNEMGHYREAIESLSEAIKVQEDSDAYFFRGIAYCNLAIEIANSSKGSMEEVADLYENAIDDYDEAIELDPNNVILYFKRAELGYEIFSEREEVIEYYEKIVELEPENEDAYVRMAEIYAELGNSKKQEKYYKDVLNINSNNLKANVGLADYYYEQNKYKNALAYINLAIELNSDEEWLRLAQGECYCELKQYDKALQVYNNILENSENESVYDYRGDVYFSLKQYDKSISDYLKFIELKPESKGVYYRLGLAYKENGDYNKAIESLNKAIKLLPNNKELLDLIDEIKKLSN
ncbi:tetratricopeptide repeat protein [Clostridium sp. OS1-26]|uniref:tetratricopeptide repeat protein n=1 Tax=Clostridium sp. OS1-26 TaxID=3070681 RepID=UPI0027E104B7|nr:tetratricopeptide repeat protein [Clostridium sp. OS1-26]WML33915.1 tetratricopeptide repeat protein [Clostridium sp. OS1-26]